ncbi:MAG: hypothetical protein JJ895_11825 [Balneolaceae bacterium]|nr:hypothetical protein [Balneolaceae bacterium]
MKRFSLVCLLCLANPTDAIARSSSDFMGFAEQFLIQQPSDTLYVLFVGNSYTYYWGLAQIIEGLSTSGDTFISTRTSTASGASLSDHWHGRYNLSTKEKIINGKWDVVVLQNQSRSSIDSLDQFMSYGLKFAELIKSVGATPLLFETWAREENPFMQDLITRAHDKLATEAMMKKVPIGSLWQKIRELRPAFDLFDPDGSHPNSTGTYFNACIFYSFLTGEQATYLQTRVYTVDHHGESIQLTIQDDQEATFLQSIIDTYLISSLASQ